MEKETFFQKLIVLRLIKNSDEPTAAISNPTRANVEVELLPVAGRGLTVGEGEDNGEADAEEATEGEGETEAIGEGLTEALGLGLVVAEGVADSET
jgi:hypothetical protein